MSAIQIGFASSLLILGIQASNAQGTAQSEALKQIRETAADICTAVATEGKTSDVTLSGDARAKLDGVVGKIVNLGIEGAAKYQQTEYKNVLQKDLASAIKDGNNCRLDVFKALVDRMMPAKVSRDPAQTERQLVGYLASKNLAVPGRPYSDGELAQNFGVAAGNSAWNISYPVLTGTFSGLSAVISSPAGSFSRVFLRKGQVVVGVLMTQTCNRSYATICDTNYSDWRSALESFVGQLKDSTTVLQGGGGPFGTGGTLKQSSQFDDKWRVYIDRMDPADPNKSPLIVNFLIARDSI